MVVRPSPPAFDTEITPTSGDGVEDSDEVDIEVQRQITKPASELHKTRTRRGCMRREIATRVYALHDRKVREGNAEQARKRVKELTNVLEVARWAAATASIELEATIDKIHQIEIAEQELEQLIGSHVTLRLQFSELVD
jgi:hypothetical protein